MTKLHGMAILGLLFGLSARAQDDHMQKARAYFRAEQYESAREHLENALARVGSPEQVAEGGYVLGLIYEMDLRWPEAERSWKRATAGEASHPAVEAARARLLWLEEFQARTGERRKGFLLRRLSEESTRALHSNRPRAAVRLAQHARDIAPEQWAPHLLIGSALFAVEDFSGARAAGLLARQRGSAEVQRQIDTFLARIDQLEANRENYRDALDQRDSNRPVDAAAQFEKVYRSDARRLDAGMAAALQYADGGMNVKAMELLQELESKGPTEARLEAARLRAKLQEAGDLKAAKEWTVPPAANDLRDPQLEKERAGLRQAQLAVEQEAEKAFAAARKRREQQGSIIAELKRLQSDYEVAKMEMDTYTGRSAVASANPYFQTPSSVAAAAMNSAFASARMPVLQIRIRAIQQRMEILQAQLDLDDEAAAAAKRDLQALQEAEQRRDQERAERAAFVNGLLGSVQQGLAEYQRQSALRQQNLQRGGTPATGQSREGAASGRVQGEMRELSANSAACRACAQDPTYLRYMNEAMSSIGQVATHQAAIALYQCSLRNGGCGYTATQLQSSIQQEQATIQSLTGTAPRIVAPMTPP